jgi:hypothetical protein
MDEFPVVIIIPMKKKEIYPKGFCTETASRPENPVRPDNCAIAYEKLDFCEECKNCIFAWYNREMRRCKNTVSALRDSRKTVFGGNFPIY